MSSADFLRRDAHSQTSAPPVPARPPQYHAKLSGIFVTDAERGVAWGNVLQNHDVVIGVTYLVPDTSAYNANLLLSFSSKLASWRNILDLLRNHFAIYHNVVVPDPSIMVILDNSILVQRRDSSRLFYADLMSPTYSGASDTDERSLQLFVAVVGRSFSHAIDGTPMRGLAIVHGDEKNIVTFPVTATVAQLSEAVYDAGVEVFVPSSNPENRDADRLAYLDRPNTQRFPVHNGKSILAAALSDPVLSAERTAIPRFSIVYHTVSDERRAYYANSAAFEPSDEDELHTTVLQKRIERGFALQDLQTRIEPHRRRAEYVLVEDSDDESSASATDENSEATLGDFDASYLE